MQTVIGLFENAFQAQKAARELISAGFSSSDVDVAVNDGNRGTGSGDAYTAGATYKNDFGENVAGSGSSSGTTTGTGSDLTGSGSNLAGAGSELTGTRSTPGDDYLTTGAGSAGYTGTTDDSLTSGSTGTSGSTASDYGTTSDYGSTGTGTGYGSSSDYSSTRSDDDDDDDDDDTSTRNRSYTSDDDNNSFGDKVSRFFKNLFGGDDDDDDRANRYSHVARSTGSMVTVYAQTRDEAERAADILDDNGAIDVDKTAADYGYNRSSASGDYSSTSNTGSDTGITGTGTGMTTGATSGTDTGISGESTGRTGTTTGNTGDTLNVINEDVDISKRQVETGGVRLRSRIVERPVEQSLRLREETVRVERTPVDRPATTADFQNFKEGEIEMTEYAEVPEITKQARVVEEVKLTKEVNERTETINETARDTEVDVENVSKKGGTGKKNKGL